jgi:hypothetical protein
MSDSPVIIERMFERGEEALPLDPALLAWYEERAAELAAAPADPLDDETPSVAELLREAETAPMTPALAARVLNTDVADLDDAGRVALAVALTRLSNSAQARLATLIAADVAATPPVLDRNGNIRIGSQSQCALEFASALRLGNGTADALVGRSVAMATRHPRTLAAGRAGDLSWDKATALADATASLTREQARAVEDRVLPKAAQRVLSQHRAAVKRAVDAVDPQGAADRHRAARDDVRFIREHHGDGVGQLFAQLPAEQLDVVWTAADAWARRRKADGDERSLEVLRVASLVQWAQSFLVHGDPTRCDTACEPFADATTAPSAGGSPPTHHGRPATIGLLWDLPGLLGYADHGAELVDTAAPVSVEVMCDLLARGIDVRRVLVDERTGELLDLTPTSWSWPATAASTEHAGPYTLYVVVTRALWAAMATGDVTGLSDSDLDELHRLKDALAECEDERRELILALLSHPRTADDLDSTPDAYPVPSRLAEFVALRDRHPMTPTASPVAATTGDADHTTSFAEGGLSVRDNLTTPTRRWHLAKTLGGWSLHRISRHWVWFSPRGRQYRVDPHDYRRGP